MNVRKLLDGDVSDRISNVRSVLRCFGVVCDSVREDFISDSEYLGYLSSTASVHNLSEFIFDVSVSNSDDAAWRWVLKEMETKWVSFYGAKKYGQDDYRRDTSRMFVGTRNPDFIPADKRAKGLMESGSTWDMTGEEKKWDYLRFFDRSVGEWRSTVKTFMVPKGKIPDEEQVPYNEWLQRFAFKPAPLPKAPRKTYYNRSLWGTV